MFRKKIYRPLPKSARLIAPGRVRVRIGGKWVDREVNDAGLMIDFSSKWYSWIRDPKTGKRKAVPLERDREAGILARASQIKKASRQKWELEPNSKNDPSQPLLDLVEKWLEEMSKGAKAYIVPTIRPSITRMIGLIGLQKLRDLQDPDLTQRIREAMESLKNPEPLKLPEDKTSFTVVEARAILEITQPSFWEMRNRLGIRGVGKSVGRKFTRDEMAAFASCKARGLSPKSINDHARFFGRFCRWLVRNGMIMRDIRLPELFDQSIDRRLVRRALTWEDCKKLATAARKSDEVISKACGLTREVLYRVAFLSLLRNRALRELKVSDLRFTGSDFPFISVRPEIDKRKVARAIPILDDETVKKLKHLVSGKKPDDRVFTFNHVTISRAIRADLAKAGIPYRTEEGVVDLHAFRHSGATHLMSKGVDPFWVAKVGGWSTINEILQRYGHLSPKSIGEQLRGAF
jgi:integrase